MPHPNEPDLQTLKDICSSLYKKECTEEVAKQIKAVEAQIARITKEEAAKAAAAKAELSNKVCRTCASMKTQVISKGTAYTCGVTHLKTTPEERCDKWVMQEQQ